MPPVCALSSPLFRRSISLQDSCPQSHLLSSLTKGFASSQRPQAFCLGVCDGTRSPLSLTIVEAVYCAAISEKDEATSTAVEKDGSVMDTKGPRRWRTGKLGRCCSQNWYMWRQVCADSSEVSFVLDVGQRLPIVLLRVCLSTALARLRNVHGLYQ